MRRLAWCGSLLLVGALSCGRAAPPRERDIIVVPPVTPAPAPPPEAADTFSDDPWKEYELAIREAAVASERSTRRFAHARRLLVARVESSKRKALPAAQSAGSFTFTASKKRAWVNTIGGLVVVDVAEAHAIDFLPKAHDANVVAYGERAILSSANAVIMYDAASTKSVMTLAARGTATVDNVGRTMAYPDAEGSFVVFDLASMQERQRFTRELAQPQFLGDRFLTIEGGEPCVYTFEILDIVSGRTVTKFPSSCTSHVIAAVHPASTHIAVTHIQASEPTRASVLVDVVETTSGKRVDRITGVDWGARSASLPTETSSWRVAATRSRSSTLRRDAATARSDGGECRRKSTSHLLGDTTRTTFPSEWVRSGFSDRTSSRASWNQGGGPSSIAPATRYGEDRSKRYER